MDQVLAIDGVTVLVADDDPRTRDVLRRYLTRANFTVIEAADGPSALASFHDSQPQLVLLDLMMPGLDGLDVCAMIREQSDVPIIMLTALGSESDRVVGLEHGADDYVVKPFSPREVTLRVQRVLNRTLPQEMPAETAVLLHDGDLMVNPVARTAYRDAHLLELTLREFDLLAFLMAHPRQAFTRRDLLQQVWGWDFGDDSTVTVHARRLREKVEFDPAQPSRIVTVRGVGYRWEPWATETKRESL